MEAPLTVLVQVREDRFQLGGERAQLVQPRLDVALPPLFVNVRGIDGAKLPEKVAVEEGALPRTEVGGGAGERLEVEQGRAAHPRVARGEKGLRRHSVSQTGSENP